MTPFPHLNRAEYINILKHLSLIPGYDRMASVTRNGGGALSARILAQLSGPMETGHGATTDPINYASTIPTTSTVFPGLRAPDPSGRVTTFLRVLSL